MQFDRNAVKLSPIELTILRLKAQGLRQKAISKQLGISEKTISRHMGRIFAKLKLFSTKEILEYLRGRGDIDGQQCTLATTQRSIHP